GDDDLVPGIDGIGAKGATQLLEEHGTVDGAVAKLESLNTRARKALEGARDELAKHLAHARLDRGRALPVPLDRCAFTAPAAAALNAELDALGFVELLRSTAAATRVTMCRAPEDFAAALTAFGARVPSVHALLDDGESNQEAIQGVGISAGGGEAWYVDAKGPA